VVALRNNALQPASADGIEEGLTVFEGRNEPRPLILELELLEDCSPLRIELHRRRQA